MKKKALALCLVGCIPLLYVGCASYNKRCGTSSSFGQFRANAWEPYCESYKQHIENPSQFSMRDMTTFFGNHPAKVKELKQQVGGHGDYEMCFEGGAAELELRELESCLDYDDTQQLAVINAWEATIEPWLEETQFQYDELEPKLIEVEKEMDRFQEKVGVHFANKQPVPQEIVDDYAVAMTTLNELEERIDTIQKTGGRFDELVANAKGNPPLVEAMSTGQAPEIDALAAELSSAKDRIDAARKSGRFVGYAFGSVGIPCPRGKSAKKESKIADDVLGEKLKTVGAKEVQIASEIKTDKKGDVSMERFTGYVCGKRSADNQFEDAPELCGQYQFVIERQKAGDSWGAWAVKAFEEAGAGGGVDCDMLVTKKPSKGKPKKKQVVF